MVELKIYLSESLNEKFRRIAMTVFGYGRGSLSKAAEEAFAMWCAQHNGPPQETSAAKVSESSEVTEASGVNPDERTGTGGQQGATKNEPYPHDSSLAKTAP